MRAQRAAEVAALVGANFHDLELAVKAARGVLGEHDTSISIERNETEATATVGSWSYSVKAVI